MPLISICIPTYDRVNLLKKTLDSIISNHSYDQIEIIITDNGSSDAVPSMIKKYNHILNIRYVRNSQNIGASKNLFKSFSLAKGEYIWMFSDDDIFMENSINYLKNFLINNPSIDYVFYPRMLGNVDLTLIDKDTQPRGVKNNIIYSSGLELFSDYEGQMPGLMGYLCSNIIRRKLWRLNCLKHDNLTGSGFRHLRIIFDSIKDKKCAILGKAGVIARLENGREISSKVWFDEYISIFKMASEMGYSKLLCDNTIRKLTYSFSKMFVVNKAHGLRDDNIYIAAKKLGILHLLEKRQPWYPISFLPIKLLNPLIRTYFAIRSLLLPRKIM